MDIGLSFAIVYVWEIREYQNNEQTTSVNLQQLPIDALLIREDLALLLALSKRGLFCIQRKVTPSLGTTSSYCPHPGTVTHLQKCVYSLSCWNIGETNDTTFTSMQPRFFFQDFLSLFYTFTLFFFRYCGKVRNAPTLAFHTECPIISHCEGHPIPHPAWVPTHFASTSFSSPSKPSCSPLSSLLLFPWVLGQATCC